MKNIWKKQDISKKQFGKEKKISIPNQEGLETIKQKEGNKPDNKLLKNIQY